MNIEGVVLNTSAPVWAGYALAWFDAKCRDSAVLIPLHRPFSASYVIKDGDLALDACALRDRFLEPLCREVFEMMTNTTPVREIGEYQTSGNVAAIAMVHNISVRVEFAYDVLSAGVRCTLTAMRGVHVH